MSLCDDNDLPEKEGEENPSCERHVSCLDCSSDCAVV